MIKIYTLTLFLLAALMPHQVSTQDSKDLNKDQKVIVISKQVDSEGKVLVKEVAHDGNVVTTHSISADNAEVVHAAPHQGEHVEVQVDVHVEGEGEDLVRTIKINKNGETQVIELKGGAELSEEQRQKLESAGILVLAGEDGVVQVVQGEDFDFDFDFDFDYDFDFNFDHDFDFDFDYDFDFDFDVEALHGHAVRTGANCIALGVFVNSGYYNSLRIQSIIDGSGAEDAGLQSGDIIRGIGKEPVDNYQELHLALSQYEPGDVTEVDLERDGQLMSVSAELRAWGDLPDYENSWRAQVDCGDPDYQNQFNFLKGEEEVRRKVIIIKKSKAQEAEEEEPVNQINTSPAGDIPAFDNTLQLKSFVAFPNPSEGRFRVRFEGEPKPMTLSIYDTNGREVFRDRLQDFSGVYDRQIDLRNAVRGSLILSVLQDGKRYTDQVILQ